MRLSEEKIKHAILYPDEEIRYMAVEYFSKSFSADTTIMPLVIESVEKYGRENAYMLIGTASQLKQTEDTICWILGELNRDVYTTKENEINYYFNLSRILTSLDLDLLFKYESKIIEAPHFYSEIREDITQPLQMYSWGADKCWKALEDFCEREKNKRYVNEVNLGYADNLIKVVAYYGDNYIDRVISLLDIEIGNYANNPMRWMETFMVQLAGEMRLEQAAPYIIKNFI